ncbi:MAG: hypothetical protein ABI672_13655 [Vicinamibacteria bacterium]
MKNHLFRRVALAALCLSLFAADAFAVPAFARRYSVKCSFCHEIFPKLNRAGERFKERGFRLDSEDKFERSVWLKSAPLSGRVIGARNLREGRDDDTYGDLKVLSAGNLGEKVSYWADDAWIRSGGETFHVKPDNVWARFDIKAKGKLYAKAGRFELDLPATQTRTPHLLPYEIYGTNTGLESDGIGQYQSGIEVGGEIGTTHLSAALVKGRNNDGVPELADRTGVGEPEKFDGNLFLRVSKRRATSRFGAFSYIGRNQLVANLDATHVGLAKDKLLRIGIDGNARFKQLNVYGIAMYGSNSNSEVTASGTSESLNFAGGFLAVDYSFRDFVAVTARVQTRSVENPGSTPRASVTSFLPGLQVVIWKVKVSGQVSLANHNTARFGVVQVETAF